MPKLRPLFKAERSSDVKLWEDKLLITLGEPVILRSSNPKIYTIHANTLYLHYSCQYTIHANLYTIQN